MKDSIFTMYWRYFKDGWFFTLGWLLKFVIHILCSPIIYIICGGWIPLAIAAIVGLVFGDFEIAIIPCAIFQFIPLTIHTYMHELGEDTACSKEMFLIVCVIATLSFCGVAFI